MIMLFSFMVLFTINGNDAMFPSRKSPEKHELSKNETVKSLNKSQLGSLEKNGESLLLRFESEYYDPKLDFDKLVSDGRITESKDKKDGIKRVIYLYEDNKTGIFLSEYLNTFKYLGDKGVSVAFAERIR